MTKRCSKCKQTKGAEEFYKDRKRPDGLQSWCKRCRRALYQEKQDEYLTYAAQYREENKEAIRERRHGWTKLTPAEKAKYDAERRANNPHIGWERGYIQRCQRMGIEPVIEPFTKEDVIRLYGDACVDCGGAWTELEHEVPVIAGGPHTLTNVRPICKKCNHDRWIAYQRAAFVYYSQALRDGRIPQEKE